MWVWGEEVNLKNLALKIQLDKKLLTTCHPSNIEIIKRHMEKQKELIIKCLMENLDNPLLEKIKCN